MLTDASGAEPQPLDAICEDILLRLRRRRVLADGSRLAFVRYGSEEGASVIATMDLATGAITELESTRITDLDQGTNDAPAMVARRHDARLRQAEHRRAQVRPSARPSSSSSTRTAAISASSRRRSSARSIPTGRRTAHGSSSSPRSGTAPSRSAGDRNGHLHDPPGWHRPAAPDDRRRIGSTELDCRRADRLRPHASRRASTRSWPDRSQLWIMDADGANVRQLQADSARGAHGRRLRDLPLSAAIGG